MKYKLINSVTKIETLCDKVTIDGFDYYVSDGDRVVGDYYIGKGFNGNNIFEWSSSQENQYPNQKGKVIATNNPNIDVPKVVDVFTVLEQWSKSKEKLVYQHWNKPSFMEGYNKSQETHPFSEEDMIEFGEWKDYNFYQHIEDNLYRTMQARPMYKVLENKSYTTKELLQIWKEQRPKTLYYE